IDIPSMATDESQPDFAASDNRASDLNTCGSSLTRTNLLRQRFGCLNGCRLAWSHPPYLGIKEPKVCRYHCNVLPALIKRAASECGETACTETARNQDAG